MQQTLPLGIGLGIAMGGFMIDKINFDWTLAICAASIGLGLVHSALKSVPYFQKNKLA
jgi:predicted MFS family arabinose efflux permease